MKSLPKILRLSFFVLVAALFRTPFASALTLSFTGTGTDQKPCSLTVQFDSNNEISSISITGYETSSGLPNDDEQQPGTVSYSTVSGPTSTQSSNPKQTQLKSSFSSDGARGTQSFDIEGDIRSKTLASATVKEEAFVAEIIPLHGDAIQCNNLSQQ